MFFEGLDHGLPFDPFKAIVAPRPIGWISTLDPRGVPNLAPYSFFNALSAKPHLIGFGSGAMRHTPRNARDTGEFVFNLTSRQLADKMNLSSAEIEDGQSEFDHADITMAPCRIVKAPRVAEAPAALECRVVHFMEFKDLDGRDTGRFLVVGQVVGTHLADEFVVDGRFDCAAAQVIARCGYHDYAMVERLFQLPPVR